MACWVHGLVRMVLHWLACKLLRKSLLGAEMSSASYEGTLFRHLAQKINNNVLKSSGCLAMRCD